MERVVRAQEGYNNGKITNDVNELEGLIEKIKNKYECQSDAVKKEGMKNILDRLTIGLKREKSQIRHNGRFMDTYIQGMARNTDRSLMSENNTDLNICNVCKTKFDNEFRREVFNLNCKHICCLTCIIGHQQGGYNPKNTKPPLFRCPEPNCLQLTKFHKTDITFITRIHTQHSAPSITTGENDIIPTENSDSPVQAETIDSSNNEIQGYFLFTNRFEEARRRRAARIKALYDN
ncbi:Oidioi.mRNA.OKI2018_I69.chr2.g4864.t1.cds [Oikopleura dioica]|uniref:Oidioi.mRNA.OKI2018_I69.chr2.g4864.t1.cds n=1 Tax=Oikopleura dioica TaxID=34765 RepID=A0ABN7SYR4_OIKDI|nr:Oidioi.mRNA.OKI2018_I69.chr2.g4864.t1.cds [Oikopleura dioica]